MNHDEAIEFLTNDGAGLLVPCSRYGRNSADCAEVAWSAAEAFAEDTGEEITEELLDHLMGLVVNDHDDIAHLLNDITRYDWAYEAAEERAKELGAEAGANATPGSTLDLSGEWADGPNGDDIVREILDASDTCCPDEAPGYPESMGGDESRTALLDAYEEAYNEAVPRPSVWDLTENPDQGCEAVADLYTWSTNYDPGKGPMTLFLDLIGWSDEHIGEPLYNLATVSLGYLELSKLAEALTEYADRPHDVSEYVDKLMDAEGRD